MIYANHSDEELRGRVEGLIVSDYDRALLTEVLHRWTVAADRVSEIDKADYDFAHHENDGPQEMFR